MSCTFKKGDPKDTNNYRGITLLSVVGKLTNKVITNRLIGATEEHELLHEAQNAFRPGRSTDDHIFTLSQLVRGRKNRNQRYQHNLRVLPGPAKGL